MTKPHDTHKHAGKDTHKTHDASKVVHEEHGQGLLHRVEVRRAEFAGKLAASPNDPAREPSHASALEAALAGLTSLLPGDLENISSTNAAELSRWLDATRDLSDEGATQDPRPVVKPPGEEARYLRV